jgi:PAS domain S-box-containing protein
VEFDPDRLNRSQLINALRVSEARFRAIADYTYNWESWLDPDGRLVWVNRAVERVTGYSVGDCLDMPDYPLPIVLPEDRERVARHLQAAMVGSDERDVEFRILRKDGAIGWVAASWQAMVGAEGEILGYRSSARDHTRRRQVEMALRASEGRYRALVKNLPNGGVFLFDRQLRLTIVHGLELLQNGLIIPLAAGSSEAAPNGGRGGRDGLRDATWKGKSPGSLFPPELRGEIDAHSQAALEGISNLFQVTRGSRIYEIRTLPVLDDHSNEILGGMALAQDITERVQANQLLEKAVQDRTRELSTLLEVSQRVASLQERQPLLTLILDYLEKMVNFSAALILSPDEGAPALLAQRGLPGGGVVGELVHWLDVSGVHQELLGCGDVTIIEDLHDPRGGNQAFLEWGRDRLAGEFAPLRSLLCIPLKVKERLFGLLYLAHATPGYFTPRHGRLALTIANQAAVALENARLYAQGRKLAAVEERQRIARELHDSVTQSLYSITLYGQAAAKVLQADDAAAAARFVGDLNDTSQEALNEMRLLIYELRPPLVAEEGLAAALQNRLDAVEARSGLKVNLEVEGEIRPPAAVEDALYRIAQEALNNVLKHAQAKKVGLQVRLEPGRAELLVVDDGRGFNSLAWTESGGWGLQGMAERAQQLGGVLRVENLVSGGTQVHCVIPYPAPSEG